MKARLAEAGGRLSEERLESIRQQWSLDLISEVRDGTLVREAEGVPVRLPFQQVLCQCYSRLRP